ncbi:hypothetical protein [Pseudomonas sp. IT-P176]|uniref:hypothetical protein n=1 Tax=Pseudomonas sp. IT-P176 TaxID=3026444 RepID=UPI0039DFC3CF
MRLEFAHLLPIYKAMQSLQGSRYSMCVTQEIKNSLILILDDDEALPDSGFSYAGDSTAIVEGAVIEIHVNSPRLGLGILASDFSDYLSKAGTVLKEKSHFFLTDSNFYSKDAIAPAVVESYRSVLRFIDVLKESAYYLDEKAEALIFYKDGRFEIPLKYSCGDVLEFDVGALENLHILMSGKLHAAQKSSLLAQTVIELTQSLPPSERFAFLVKSADDLYQKAQVGYNLFSTDFTYEKAKEEVHAFKLETTSRLHKVISEIQTQLLGIPIATFVALSQIKKTNSLDSQFAINTVILFGAIIFCLLLGGLLLNQKLTLNTIEADVKRQRKIFEKRFETAPDAYEGVFRGICSRLTFQFCAIFLVSVLTVLVVAVSFIFYVVHTRPWFDVFFS